MELQYNIRETVWAKVDPHPWWPGKIVKILTQNKKTVYKVSFFADSTYTFLHQYQLIPFNAFDHSLNAQNQHLPQLLKAIQMAELYEARINTKKQEDTLDIAETPIGDFSQEQKTEELALQNIVIRQENKYEEEEKEMSNDSPIQLEDDNMEITPQNVLQMIERNRKRQKISDYSYQNRKEEMQLQAELKRNLLMKYNLHQFDVLPQLKQVDTSSKRKIIQLTPQNITSKHYKRICKGKSKTNSLFQGETDMLKRKCIRKVTSILKNENEAESSKLQAIKIVKRIIVLAEDNRIKLQSLFVTLIKALSLSNHHQKCEERLYQFSNYLEQLQNDKHEDEGSKVTQIQVLN